MSDLVIYPVHSTSDNWYFSKAVTREFGENKYVRLLGGEVVFNVVQPLQPHHMNLPLVGHCFGVREMSVDINTTHADNENAPEKVRASCD